MITTKTDYSKAVKEVTNIFKCVYSNRLERDSNKKEISIPNHT